MDQMSGADNAYDILDEDQMTKFALEVNEAGKTNRLWGREGLAENEIGRSSKTRVSYANFFA